MKNILLIGLSIIITLNLLSTVQAFEKASNELKRDCIIEKMQHPEHKDDEFINKITEKMSDEELTIILGL